MFFRKKESLAVCRHLHRKGCIRRSTLMSELPTIRKLEVRNTNKN